MSTSVAFGLLWPGRKSSMNALCKVALAAGIVPALFGSIAAAQTPKELKVLSGKSVIVINFVGSRADCSSNPGPVAFPSLRGKPANGVLQLQIVMTAIPAAGGCPPRKVPTTALIYTPNKDFAGKDAVELELNEGNKTTTLSYEIIVQQPGEPL
jgi:hypothetical protein